MGLLRKIIEWCYAHDSDGHKNNGIPENEKGFIAAKDTCQANIRLINDRLLNLTREKQEIEKAMTDLIKVYQQTSASTNSGYKVQIMALKKDLDAKVELEKILETKLQQQVLLLNKLRVNEEISKLENQISLTDELIIDNKAKLQELECSQRHVDKLAEVEYKGSDEYDDDSWLSQKNDEDEDFQKFIQNFSDNSSSDNKNDNSTNIQEGN